MPMSLGVSLGRQPCPHALPFIFSHGHVHVDRVLQGRLAAHAEDAFAAAVNRAESQGADLVYVLTNATAFPKCIYILSMLFTHMFNKSLFII